VSGLSDKEIASALGIPLATIRTYVSRIYKALGVHNRLGLAAKWAGRRTE
jgi:DNA-binding NarL/FixJ family response regulator